MTIREFNVDLGSFRPQQMKPTQLVYVPGVYAPTAFNFYAREVHDAHDFWSDAPKDVLYGDTVRVNFFFKHIGQKGSVIVEAGSCVCNDPIFHGYLKGPGDTKSVDLTYDQTAKPYSDYVDFVFDDTVFDYPHLYVLLTGQEYEVVYEDAFVPGDTVFSKLKIIDYSRKQA